jgi:hypothetical protein
MDIIDSEKLMAENQLASGDGGQLGELKLKTQDFLNADHLKIIEENEEPQTIERILEATCSASASVYDAIKLSSSLAKNFTQISDMLDVHLNDVDKKPFKVDEAMEKMEGELQSKESLEENEPGEELGVEEKMEVDVGKKGRFWCMCCTRFV